jgi:hypothetical protein
MTVLLSANPHELESANRCINHRVLGWLCKNYSRILILSKLIDVEINVYGKWGLQARRSSTVGPIQTRQKKKKTTTTLIDINRIN